MTEQIKRVITLSDDPASTDAFGRAHDRVAEAIADVIKTDPKVGGKMIGLEGDWGGGKSTVVELLEKRFADDDNTRFFLYDAWAHQGNTLRRNFIDSLSKEIEQPRPMPWVSIAPISGIDSRTKWEKERDELANRSSTTTTRIYPKGTVFGKLMALWIVFITVAIPLLVVGFDRHYDADPATSGMAHFTMLAFLLVIYPLAVVISRAIYLWWKQLPFTGEGSWSWLVGDAVKESESTTSRTPDSTSIEFEALFDKLLREALDGENSFGQPQTWGRSRSRYRLPERWSRAQSEIHIALALRLLRRSCRIAGRRFALMPRLGSMPKWRTVCLRCWGC